MENIFDQYKTFFALKQEQEKEKAQIMLSDEYLTLSKQIEELKEKQEEMLSELPDCSSMLNHYKDQIIEEMKAKGEYSIQGVKAKTRKTNKVNVQKVMNALQGDIDLFYSVCDIKQKTLTDFSKENPQYKDELKDAVEVVSEDIVDIIPV